MKGLVDFAEPVVRLFPQGMVHMDGEVMSKSKGNTVAPDTLQVNMKVTQHGMKPISEIVKKEEKKKE